ncbi:unnamed protein product [Taenia asiatica]|uniref:UBIQUITIN_CONJUGAT_2 domain-containing protein n=1 Tax=Taenia asiatica TaxID=60517 RepID=A0A0R3VYK6_TAEAS|nr:unnamed protein product [Taenia asiatica]
MTLPAAQRTFMKDLQQLYRTIDASTDGQASIVGIDEMTVKVSLRPKAGYNAHAEFLVTIECCVTYPKTCPNVIFNTPIFHPNIDPSSGTVCISILDDWQSCYSLLDLVKAFLYLIDHPNFDAPYGDFGIPEASTHLARNSARLLAGFPVNGLHFPPNSAWVEWARANGCLPNEKEEELEEVVVEAYKNEDFDQKGDKEIYGPANTAASDDEKSNIATSYASSDTTSDTVPSFAKIRYLHDPNGEDISWGPYGTCWLEYEVKSQRILIWPPSNDTKFDDFTVFFFIEFLGTIHHRFDLGENYSTLFIGNVLHECQSHPESRQTSSDCPWYAFQRLREFSYHSPISYDSSLNLSDIFEDKETPMHDLTADFCPWSELDGKGINALFDGLFFEDSRNRGNFTCFLDEDGDGDDSIGRLFDTCLPSYKEFDMEPDELSGTEFQSVSSNQLTKSPSESEVSLTEEQGSAVNEPDNARQKAFSSASSTTYRDIAMPCVPITECPDCRCDYRRLSGPIDAGLAPLRKWILRQTRWPFRFAPQQNVDPSMTGIQVLPWRASSGRMMSDVCQFCAKNQNVSNLVLLDPMVSHLVREISCNALYVYAISLKSSDFVTCYHVQFIDWLSAFHGCVM